VIIPAPVLYDCEIDLSFDWYVVASYNEILTGNPKQRKYLKAVSDVE
jgi:hypothetical protein